MTLLQRISRSARNALLLCPRSLRLGGRRRGLNILIFVVFFFTFTFYIAEKHSVSRTQLAAEPPKLEKRAHIDQEQEEKTEKIEVEKQNEPDKQQQQQDPTTPITSTTSILLSTSPVVKKEVVKKVDVTRKIEAAAEKKDQERDSQKPLKPCLKRSPKLVGDMNSNPNITPSMDEVAKHVGPDLSVGGCYSPKDCIALQKVAVIIPFKDRDAHLKTLLYHLHPMLMRQRIHYCIYVAEQFDNGQFNKATVMNAAFEEATKIEDYDCIIFHDVDMIPENDRNFYMCGDQPRHLSPAIDKFQYKPHYGTDFGGVTGITPAQYRKANGHSNRFWGWGGEDNDMEFRIQYRNMTIVPSSLKVGRYMMIPHLHPWKFSPNKYPWKMNNTRKLRADTDGLSDLQYRLLETKRFPMYTKLIIDIRRILVTKTTLYIDGRPTMDIDLYPGQCRYESFPGKYLDFVIELTDKKEAQNISLWPGVVTKDGKSSLIKDNLIGPDGRKRRFSMLHDLKQAQELCDKLAPECAGIQRENKQENYSLRRGSIPRHLVISGPSAPKPPTVPPDKDGNERLSAERRRYILPEKFAYLRYCPGEFSHFRAHKPAFMCTDYTKPCGHQYSFEVHFKVVLNPAEYMYYTDEKHFESHLEKGENHYTFQWPGKKMPNFTDPSTPRKYTFRTPDFAIPNIPGTYAVESQIVDKYRQPYFQWNWWFEVTSGDRVTDARTRDTYWKKKMNENMMRSKAQRHQAMQLEKSRRQKQNQEEYERKMAELKKNPSKPNPPRVHREHHIGMPKQIAKLVNKAQEFYDKGEKEGDPVAALFDSHDPIFQKNVGEIKAADGDPDPGPRPTTTTTTLKTTTTKKLVRIPEIRRQFHIGLPSNILHKENEKVMKADPPK